MLCVRPLLTLFAGIVIILTDAVPTAFVFAPQTEGAGIDRAIVAGDEKAADHLRLGRCPDVYFLIEHRVNNALSRNPFALNKTLVKCT